MKYLNVLRTMPRHLFLPALLASLALFSTVTHSKEWAFDVYLDKSKIGQHVFSLNADNELTSTAKFNVKILFLNAYQYDHQTFERWQGDCLLGLQSHTVENKVISTVQAQLTGSNFTVDDGKRIQQLPDCTLTFAYWNPKILTQTRLLNPQNAEWLDTKISKLGMETIEVKGKKVEAMHYRIDGTLEGKPKLKIELWYSTGNEWLALRSTTPEGYIINYKLR
jgi:hypothetical protein